MNKVPKSEEEWKKILNKKEFDVLRKKATEQPFTGAYLGNKDEGLYYCKGCENPLFSSKTKFDSGSGWPSFYDTLSEESVDLQEDNELYMLKTEVVCKRCGSHLGHVFNDGPEPTGKRYCINSISLDFEKSKK